MNIRFYEKYNSIFKIYVIVLDMIILQLCRKLLFTILYHHNNPMGTLQCRITTTLEPKVGFFVLLLHRPQNWNSVVAKTAFQSFCMNVRIQRTINLIANSKISFDFFTMGPRLFCALRCLLELSPVCVSFELFLFKIKINCTKIIIIIKTYWESHSKLSAVRYSLSYLLSFNWDNQLFFWRRTVSAPK